jgi:8-oxo-dGTP pyrophosphatase MutT (NUDIX family)
VKGTTGESSSSADPRFGVLREALASYASDYTPNREDPAADAAQILQAAVALVVRAGEHLEVLLIKRAKRDGDPWSGHMALPGGRRDAHDDSLLETAKRETREETGVALDERGVHLGRLEEVRPQSARLPRLSVMPHVFGVPPETRAYVASPEVDAVHWVSIDLLRQPETRSVIEIPLPGGARSFPCLRVADDVVWGLTYRILEDFLTRAPEVFPLPRGE